ncbi:hypothetical protein GCM10010082_09940 [Kushneria pakistanensis]|uniref:DUF2628 domain-containing protein n=1 Tax=Kushneria pakistanensis TaxID=1508770 RepID=A0ABQ3FDU5_9GAMM|nr:DUF2628 domain-containing protein [Kushneria pakistanensis]GHC20133.1 hypothetical protein GCM10010082_09940 [Kushneria pakistanensis]
MKRFDVYQHSSGRLDAVKQGWSWPAFFFGALWALYCRLWKIAALTLLGVFVVSMAGTFDESGMLDLMVNIACLGLYIAFGINGNHWKRRHLTSTGFHFKETVAARGVKQAIAEHLERQQPLPTDASSHTFQA